MPTPKVHRVPEKVVQMQILRTLVGVGGRVYVAGTRRPKGDHQGTCQTPGLPDIPFAFVPDKREGREGKYRQLVVEVKADGGRPSLEQLAFRDLCAASDVAYVMGGLDDVLGWLIEAGNVRAENVPHYRRAAL